MLKSLRNNRDKVYTADAFHELELHLIAVSRYENKQKAKKVVKHMKGWKSLLDQQLEKDVISDKAFDSFQKQADKLIKKWK
ncbi:hypothetical protein [Virgibacillus sp. Bac332]|uniref:FIMAH domain-containing protein n=1 Tax=Virgibacillus sp. Bac332 TaxID=2419842 RepID=UPI00196A16D2|nr:hypothetical protein [Virgibacillus sp. Bac332]